MPLEAHLANVREHERAVLLVQVLSDEVLGRPADVYGVEP
jgi:hypothetical protein